MLTGISIRAFWYRAPVFTRIAPDLCLGRRVHVELAPGRSSGIDIGPGCKLGDDVMIRLTGGHLVLGPGVDIRPRSVLNVSGSLVIAKGALIQHGCTIHCDDEVTIGEGAIFGEYVTVADSNHTGGADGWQVDRVATSPVRVGRHVWLAAKATVTRGSVIGDHSCVAANSVVVGDTGSESIVSGVPARRVHTITSFATSSSS